MKIGIEGQRIFRKKKHGMDFVALELIKNLQKIDNENQYVIFVKPDEDDQVLEESDNLKIHYLEGAYPWWEQINLPKAALKEKCDLLHCTSDTGPVFSGLPVVLTLHDIIYLENLSIAKKGGTWYQKLGNLYRRWIVPSVFKKSKRIITVSESEKETIQNYFNIRKDDKRVEIVYNGVSEHFKPITDDNTLKRVKNKYKLPEKYILFLGNTDPKKNTEGVLEAYSQYVKETEQPLPLVLLDYEEKWLDQLLKRQGIEDIKSLIILLGYVVNKNLPAIYSLSAIFLYPSLRESFGIPILEAMSCGTPVITSKTSSMPEVSGGAAKLVDPFKKDEIASAIKELLNDEKQRNQLVEKGFERASKFTWMSMAENVLQIYKDVVKNQ